jgi:hypothetical protein
LGIGKEELKFGGKRETWEGREMVRMGWKNMDEGDTGYWDGGPLVVAKGLAIYAIVVLTAFEDALADAKVELWVFWIIVLLW